MHLYDNILSPSQDHVELIAPEISLEQNISSAYTTINASTPDLQLCTATTSLKKDATDYSPICLYLTEITNNVTPKNLPTSTEIVVKEKTRERTIAITEQKAVHAKSKRRTLMPSNYQQHKLQTMIPELLHFNIHRKIGCGTFSSVYLATLKNNSAQYAIKHHIPTASPARVEWEYKCLLDIGGVDNVCGIKAAFRKNDCTVFVMPYLSHVRFSDYMLDMDVAETRGYIRGLLTALARVHSFNIIHRDVKPSNYLYNRQTGKCLLVDFGLASESFHLPTQSSATPLLMEYSKRKRYTLTDDVPCDSQPKRRALQTRLNDNIIVPKPAQLMSSSARKRRKAENRPPLSERMSNGVCKNLFANHERAEPANDHGVALHLQPANSQQTAINLSGHRQLKRTIDNSTPIVRKENGTLMAPRTTKPEHTERKVPISVIKAPGERVEMTAQKLKNSITLKERYATQESNAFKTLTPSNKSGVSFVRVQNSQVKSVNSKSARTDLFALPSATPQCTCYSKARVCSICSTRRVKIAPRAGTPGFRPPEVLFKYTYQTTAVDMWAAGVVLLCIMSGSYPFFKSPDDLSALAEITMLFGSDKVKEIARKLGRHVQFSDAKLPLNIRKLCETLRQRKQQHSSSSDDTPSTSPNFLQDATVNDVNNTSSLCSNCMQMKDFGSGCLCAKECVANTVEQKEDNVFPASAYDLLTKLMDLNPHTRISAADALKHPFLME